MEQSYKFQEIINSPIVKATLKSLFNNKEIEISDGESWEQEEPENIEDEFDDTLEDLEN